MDLLKILKDRNKELNTPDYPKNMTEVGKFTYIRTYSRYIPELKRREVWRETVERAVAWSCGLAEVEENEMFELFDAVFNLHVQLAGRTLWIGGTEVSKRYPLSNFNCTFTTIKDIEALTDLFYLSMLGSGVGFSVEEKYTNQFPQVRNIDVIHGFYSAKPRNERAEHSTLRFEGGIPVLEVGDSKEGWNEALKLFLEVFSNPMYRDMDEIMIDYDSVRPKGEPLKTFGGYASGHEYLQKMFDKIWGIIQGRSIAEEKLTSNEFFQLKPIDLLDIANIIGENVVSGGVRRTAQISLFDPTQNDLIDAKANLYTEEDGLWVENEEIIHRRLSNNSVLYTEKPTLEQLSAHVDKIRFTGEPAFINQEQATKRFKKFQGVNPCAEILLRDKETCNLVAVDVALAYRDGIAIDRLFRLATRHSYRITTLELELPKWKKVLHEDRLLGVSINGLIDFLHMTELDDNTLGMALRGWKTVAHESMKEYADHLGLSHSENVTTIKPTGTQSLLGGMSAGVHNQWGQYYIRRIRLSSFDPLFKAMKKMGYKMVKDTGAKDGDTWVVEFPCKSNAHRDLNDISAIEQLEMYKLTMENYTDQNTSCTVNVGSSEWDDVKAWMYLNWDSFVGVSFLHKTESYFPLLPYETITREKYMEMVGTQPTFLPNLVNEFDDNGDEFDLSKAEKCSTGSCPLK